MKNNRLIKFRVWDIKESKFLDPGFPSGRYDRLAISIDGFGIYHGGYDENLSFSDERYVIQQFTGLLDKNGKEIYEGDILSVCGEPIEIYFEPIYMAFCGRNEKTFVQAIHFYSHNSIDLKNAKFLYGIIGNIFENPELTQSK